MQRHITDHVDFSKFGVPSWRIEQRYSPGVLIGNWSEERLKFPGNKYKHNSTNRIDFKGYGQIHPDVNIRRKAKLGGEGIPADMLFRHHGRCYDNMLITLYDENYNGRWRENKLPPLRKWDSQSLGWLPEKTDHPLRGEPTNWGLKEAVEEETLQRQKDAYNEDFESTYMGSFRDKPLESMRFARHATPKCMSTTLFPVNKVNNDLHLRGTQRLRMPEIMPDELSKVSV
ncbi:hypothetical protein PoB_002869000 [Plakobranchus ocellatus]|uniref:Uncharacterized protein n=1 Tax=Plakobranchus ocellatus TaxID=259542 RepID=A0AAV4A1Z2_9GAST|nr:hypothetical protein PoB_002869000 [Plakobranchus ocellatus]